MIGLVSRETSRWQGTEDTTIYFAISEDLFGTLGLNEIASDLNFNKDLTVNKSRKLQPMAGLYRDNPGNTNFAKPHNYYFPALYLLDNISRAVHQTEGAEDFDIGITQNNDSLAVSLVDVVGKKTGNNIVSAVYRCLKKVTDC